MAAKLDKIKLWHTHLLATLVSLILFVAMSCSEDANLEDDWSWSSDAIIGIAPCTKTYVMQLYVDNTGKVTMDINDVNIPDGFKLKFCGVYIEGGPNYVKDNLVPI